jgi:hypothetical protein
MAVDTLGDQRHRSFLARLEEQRNDSSFPLISFEAVSRRVAIRPWPFSTTVFETSSLKGAVSK